jgi:hypothetical protein
MLKTIGVRALIATMLLIAFAMPSLAQQTTQPTTDQASIPAALKPTGITVLRGDCLGGIVTAGTVPGGAVLSLQTRVTLNPEGRYTASCAGAALSNATFQDQQGSHPLNMSATVERVWTASEATTALSTLRDEVYRAIRSALLNHFAPSNVKESELVNLVADEIEQAVTEKVTQAVSERVAQDFIKTVQPKLLEQLRSEIKSTCPTCIK